MKNIDKAAKVVLEAIESEQKIGVLFDVDTDGVCSGTIMTRYLLNYTKCVSTYINTGKAHGLIGQDLERFDGLDLLIVVDSLDANTTQYEILNYMGIDVIVLDHHSVDENINYDSCITLVSSQIEYDNPYLSGAGVTFKFCKYLDKKTKNKFADEFIDLAAVGILADVSDVSENSYENRYIVYKGLKKLNNLALKKIVGSYEFNSTSVLYSVAPLINACCRCGDNEVVKKMFLSDDNKEVLACRRKLNEYKELQKEVVTEAMKEVVDQLEGQEDANVAIVIVDTGYGVNGLIANKLLSIVNKPVFVLALRDGKFMGSMRCVGYENFRTLCNETGYAELHGHEYASGVEIDKDDYYNFFDEIESVLDNIEQDINDTNEVDILIDLTDLTDKLVNKIKKLDFVSGEGFKPVTVQIDGIEDDYEISNYKNGQHLVIKYLDRIHFIEWNTNCSYEDLEDSKMFGEELSVVGTLDSGFFGKKRIIKVIMNDYETK